MIKIIITAFISFVSTNIDDIFILMLFFSQVNSIMRRRHVILGQLIGISILITISIIGALGLSAIQHEYVGLLGLVPIYLGIKAYVDYKKERPDNEDTGNYEPGNKQYVKSGETASKQEFHVKENNKLSENVNIQGNVVKTFIKNFINASVIKVASITFANGGDNIGIYIPIFISMDLLNIFITVIIFLFLTVIWCFIGLKLSEHPFVQRSIENYKHIFVPIIFIGLGIFILKENETITFIYQKVF